MRNFFNDQTIEIAGIEKFEINLDVYKADISKKAVEALHGNYESFIKRWRQHFVEKSKPNFLPKGWMELIDHVSVE